MTAPSKPATPIRVCEWTDAICRANCGVGETCKRRVVEDKPATPLPAEDEIKALADFLDEPGVAPTQDNRKDGDAHEQARLRPSVVRSSADTSAPQVIPGAAAPTQGDREAAQSIWDAWVLTDRLQTTEAGPWFVAKVASAIAARAAPLEARIAGLEKWRDDALETFYNICVKALGWTDPRTHPSPVPPLEWSQGKISDCVKAAIESERARALAAESALATANTEIAALKHDIERHIKIAADAETERDAIREAALRRADQLGREIVAKPKIVCLCGSTRFWQHFRDEGLRLTLEGKIVLSIGIAAPDSMVLANPDTEAGLAQKEMLDELHKRKIDLADEVYVLNVGGYIGKSTRGEVAYAEQHGKQITWLEPQHAAAIAAERGGRG